MSATDPREITLEMVRGALFSAVVADALDGLGFRRQSPAVALRPYGPDTVLVGRARTTLWEDMEGEDPRPYELELAAVDSCRPDDVLVAAAGGSLVSGIWGELLSTAAAKRGCAGAVVDGAVRDVRRIRMMAFPVFARGTSVLDSKHRQRVREIDVPVEIGGVRIPPGTLVLADADGVVVVPQEVEEAAIRAAWRKVHAEDEVRLAIERGMAATEAYRRYGVL